MVVRSAAIPANLPFLDCRGPSKNTWYHERPLPEEWKIVVSDSTLILVEQIEPRILLIRGQRVILAADLAAIYGVETKRLNEQVRRNATRFPGDFMVQAHGCGVRRLEIEKCDFRRRACRY